MSPSHPVAPLANLRHLFDVNPVAAQHFTDNELGCSNSSSRPRTRAKPTPATHTHATLVFQTAGHSTFEQNGLWRLEAGDVIIIPAGQPHRRVGAQEARYWGFGVNMPYFDAHEASELANPFEHVRRGASAVASLPLSRREYTFGLLRELAVQSSASVQANHAVQQSLVTLILYEVTSARGELAAPLMRDIDVVNDALRFIEHNCLQPLTPRDVARAVGRSAAYVTTALSRTTGKSAGEWIVAHKMAQARALLRHSDASVSAIAERVGYADATHFIRMFRRDAGLTPAAFRASARKLTASPTRG